MVNKKVMRALVGMLAAWVFIFGAAVSSAYVPRMIYYQGYLTDASGAPVHGTVQMTFGIWDSQTEGNMLWEELRDVEVNQGVYSLNLGRDNPIDLAFDGPCFLGVRVGTDPEMTPRRFISSAAYAFRAATVDQVGSHSHGGEDISSGIVGIPYGGTGAASAAAARANLGAAASGANADITSLSGLTTPLSVSQGGTGSAAKNFVDLSTAQAVGGAKTFSSPVASTVATGTAPLSVASTTLVTNLNADYLDGQHASAFAPAAHNHDAAYYSRTYIDVLEARIAALENKLAHLTRSGDNLYITGANLHIRSGSGATNGAVNGVGNLIVGYNELRGTGDVRTGSHNLIVGPRHNYGSYGGLAVGAQNTLSGYYSFAAGNVNTASGNYSSVGGGTGNTASALYASVSGGNNNTAGASYASVSGGNSNTASGLYSSVSGGQNNTASGGSASVSGGRYNAASGDYSSVAGGGSSVAANANKAVGHYSAILGGAVNVAGDPALTDHNIGAWSAILGGWANVTSRNYSVSIPQPAYDSGWVAISQGQHMTLTHNLGGDPDKYVVDFMFYDENHSLGRNILGHGLYVFQSDNWIGAYWKNLDASTIEIYRGSQDPAVDRVRVRIYGNN